MAHSTIVPNQNYGRITPVLFGTQKCAPSHSFGPAVRTLYLIHYVISGTGIFRIDGKEYRLRAGEMFVIPPAKEVYYKADSVHPWHYTWIGFSAESDLPCHLSPVIYAPSAGPIFKKIRECPATPGGQSAFLSARLWDLFALFLKDRSSETDYVQFALDCIHTEYVEPITVEHIAARLGLNRSYFSTLFKKKMGVSPKKYLFNYRMRVAAALLTEEAKPVSVAANSVGYTDIFNFSKMFKQHFGLSPAEYAKAHKHSKKATV